MFEFKPMFCFSTARSQFQRDPQHLGNPLPDSYAADPGFQVLTSTLFAHLVAPTPNQETLSTIRTRRSITICPTDPAVAERFVTGLPFPKGQATTRPRLLVNAHKNNFFHRGELVLDESLNWSRTLVDTLTTRLHDASLECEVDSPVDLSQNFIAFEPLNLTRVL
ncbi:hypothetical protein JTE90_009282 [Oedothorax gibbosus]|uniref:Uncharacterized protein n=1 Tax=Oedothorax gibbosus TaxID=931172 RepID=A0AAV6V3N5_9ARAC|nr:hypothetical protein JTE90_009282 [Oedothorax gibbosus]